MSSHLTGICRIAGLDGRPNDVRVSAQRRTFHITEAEYRQREIAPPFEDLPWLFLHSADEHKESSHA